MQPEATFVNHAYTIKLHNNLGSQVYHLLSIFCMLLASQQTVMGMSFYPYKIGCPCLTGLPEAI